jgi:ABC-type dipeptide/oligopeptide/nickel transport system ATPase component
MRLVEIDDLHVSFPQADGVVQAVRGASLHLDAGESLGIVGESGSGKSVTCMALLRLLREPPARIRARRLALAGTDMRGADRRTLGRLRGQVAAMVFQDPMTAFDPVLHQSAHQIAETIRLTGPAPAGRGARRGARRSSPAVEIRNPRPSGQLPHQLSGGMLQRAMIAMACPAAARARADEPTRRSTSRAGADPQLSQGAPGRDGMALSWSRTTLGVVAETCDRGHVHVRRPVVETAPVEAALRRARATPTPGPCLARCRAGRGPAAGSPEMPGASPDPSDPPPGCPFHPRCPLADARCAAEMPPPLVAGASVAACWRLA